MLKVTAIWMQRAVWAVVLTVLIVAAVYVSLGRYYIVYVEQYQQALVDRLNRYTNIPLEIGRLHGSWSKLAPIFSIENLTVYATDAESISVLTADNITFKIDTVASILKRSIQIQKLTIDGVKCSLQQTELGHWQLKGYPTQSKQGGDASNLIDLILTVERAELMGAELVLNYAKGSDALLSIQELSLNHHNQFRRLRVNATFDASEKPLTAIIESQGDPRDQSRFSAKGYLKLDDIDFSAQLPALSTFGIDLREAQVDGEVWLDWQPGSIASLQGHFSTPLLDIEALSGEALDPLKDLAFTFRAEKTSRYDWKAWIPNFKAQWQQQLFQVDHLQLEVEKNALSIALPEVNVGELTQQFLAIDLLGEKLADTLQTLSVTGQLNNVWLGLSNKPSIDSGSQRKKSTRPDFLLRANLNDVALSPWKGAPGASGVDGYLEVEFDHGRVELDSGEFSMTFPQVYTSPLEFDSVKGQVVWQLVDGRVLVDSSVLNVTADHGPAAALLDLDLPMKGGAEEPPKMTLSVGLEDTEAHFRNRFIPFFLNDDFLQWLDKGVPEGHVNHGAFIYRGSLRKGDTDNRTAQMYFDVDDTVLDYHDDWPKLDNISGLIEIDDADVKVTTTKANMFQMALSDTVVEVSPVEEGGVWLSVESKATGSPYDALRVVNESAIRNIVGDVFSNWEMAGEANSRISLGVALAGASAANDIDVSVDLQNSTLTIPDYRVDFSSLDGQLNYSSKRGMSSKGLSAKLFDKPLAVVVSQTDEKDVLVDINGRVDISDVASWSRQAALSFLSGETEIDARFEISAQGGGEFTVGSNLIGIDIDLPKPFEKSAIAADPFWLKLPISKDKTLLRMGVSDLIEIQLKFDQGVVESGLVIIDKTDNKEHEANQFVVTGQLDNFTYDEWQPLLQRYQQYDDALAASVTAVLDGVSEDVSKPSSNLEVVDATAMSVKVRDVSLGHFFGFDQHYENSRVSVERLQQAWLISASNERLEGDLVIADDDDVPLRASLKRLVLNESSSDETVASDEPAAPFEDFKLDLSVGQLYLGEELYGTIDFELRSSPESILFNNIQGEIRGINFSEEQSVNLEWLRSQGREESRLVGQFEVADLGDVLRRWNYERIIESDNGKVSLDLKWPGSPLEWQLPSLTGPVFVEINNGRFLKASEAASGTLKVVGIVNFMNIARRLQFDFSDLYKSGITYDKIDGELVFDNSMLRIVDDLEVKSPSSRFYLRGDADLASKNLDMELSATLPIANNLPWIVALAGGIPTAAGVYVASKIFEDQVDSFSSAVYSIDGDWNNPDLQLKKVFNDGKKTNTKSSTSPEMESKSKSESDLELKGVPLVEESPSEPSAIETPLGDKTVEASAKEEGVSP